MNYPDKVDYSWNQNQLDLANSQSPETIKFFRQQFPELARRFYPREYRLPKDYYRPDALPINAAATMLQMEKEFGHYEEHYENVNGRHIGASLAAILTLVSNNGVPTYFAAEEFLKAMTRTAPPKNVLLSEINWPVPAMLIMLPKAWSQEYFGFHCTLLMACRMEMGERIELAHTTKPMPVLEVEAPENCPFIATTARIYSLDGKGVGFLTDKTPIQDDTTVAQWIHTNRQSEDFAIVGPSDRMTKEFCSTASILITSLFINMLLFMQEVPELLEEQRVLIPALTRGKGQTKEIVRPTLWEPKWIGREYKQPVVPYTAGGGHHASPRTHWRDGHWHTYLVGKRRQDRKLMWIKPVIVSKPK